MLIEKFCAEIDAKYEQLKSALNGSDLNEIIEQTLEMHALVHPAAVSGRGEKTLADLVFDHMLCGNQNELVPRKNFASDLHYDGTATVPLVWQFWHTYRIEDLISNFLMGNRDQIFNSEWQKRIGAPIKDTGNALEFDEAVKFGKAIDAEELYSYMIAVGKNTRKIIGSLTLEQIHSMVPEEWVMHIFEEGGVTADLRSVWLLVFWGRLTVGGMILTPLTCHHTMHLYACLDKIR